MELQRGEALPAGGLRGIIVALARGADLPAAPPAFAVPHEAPAEAAQGDPQIPYSRLQDLQN